MSVYYNDIDPYCCKVLRKQIHLGNLPEGHVDERDIREVRASDLVGYQHIHLFAGIGGFPLGFKWASFPDHISILTGGFPCQPHSLAGKRKASTDERDLWGELYRVICELKPTWIVAENVPGLLSSEAGRFFGRILGDLAQAGYNAEWQVLPAAAFGAPHLRERIFIVANTLSTRSTSTWNISTTSISNGEESRWLQSADRIGRSSQSDTSTGATPPGMGGVLDGSTSELDDARGGRLNDHESSSQEACSAEVFVTPEMRKVRKYSTNSETPSRSSECVIGNVSLPAVPYESRPNSGNVGERIEEAENLSNMRQYIQLRTQQGQDLQPRVFSENWSSQCKQAMAYRWPAGKGEQQHDWEPPRVVIEQQPHRAQRLKTLGNAIVPQVAEYIARCIMAHAAESESVA